ncbi:MAG: HAD-IIIA family hydrolase [Promethearchaeota archaeon]
MENRILVIMGYPASGKTVIAKEYEKQGYHRLNRDEMGGSLDGLVNHLDRLYKSEKVNKFIMDNTYPTIKSRSSVVKWAHNNNFKIECKWIDIEVGDALYNASKRMIDTYGKLLPPEEIKVSKDIGIYSPAAIYRYRKAFEKPTLQEGFQEVEKVPFTRKMDKEIYTNKAILLDYDGTIRKTKSGEKYPVTPEDIEILPNRTKVLKNYQEKGYLLLGVSNQSFIVRGVFTLEQAEQCFENTHEMLGINLDYLFCPHQAYPQVCYCRKPIPGMGVQFIEKYNLDPSQCIMVGDMKTDQTFAERCGFQFVNAHKFFTPKGKILNHSNFDV